MRLQVRDQNTLTELTIPTTRVEQRANGWLWLAVRALGALALLATGAIHLHLYFGLYGAIPTIGPLFLLNFAGATALALALLGPLERIGGRHGGSLLMLGAAAGVMFAAVTFVFLLISQHTPLFGFNEPGYDPSAIAASRVTEIAAVVLLGLFLAGRVWLKAPMRRW